MRISVLADCLRSIVNAEKKGKKQVTPTLTHSYSLSLGLGQTLFQGRLEILENYAKAW